MQLGPPSDRTGGGPSFFGVGGYAHATASPIDRAGGCVQVRFQRHYPLPTTHYPLPTTHYPLPLASRARSPRVLPSRPSRPRRCGRLHNHAVREPGSCRLHLFSTGKIPARARRCRAASKQRCRRARPGTHFARLGHCRAGLPAAINCAMPRLPTADCRLPTVLHHVAASSALTAASATRSRRW